MAVNAITRTNDIDKSIRREFCMKQKRVNVHSEPVTIVRTGKEGQVTTTLSLGGPIAEYSKYESIRVPKPIAFRAKSDHP